MRLHAWAVAVFVARRAVDVTEWANRVAVRAWLWAWLRWAQCDGSVWHE